MRVLIITGLGGSKQWKRTMRYYYESRGYQVDEVPYERFNSYEYRGYDIYAGHSMGALVVQSDPFIQSDKIETWGSPVHLRGTKINNFMEGHEGTIFDYKEWLKFVGQFT